MILYYITCVTLVIIKEVSLMNENKLIDMVRFIVTIEVLY